MCFKVFFGFLFLGFVCVCMGRKFFFFHICQQIFDKCSCYCLILLENSVKYFRKIPFNSTYSDLHIYCPLKNKQKTGKVSKFKWLEVWKSVLRHHLGSYSVVSIRSTIWKKQWLGCYCDSQSRGTIDWRQQWVLKKSGEASTVSVSFCFH